MAACIVPLFANRQEGLSGMSATIELFEKWKAAKGIESDRQALRTLGLSPGCAVHWKAGKEAGADVIEKLAKGIGENPAIWAAKAMAGQTRGETQRAWQRIARQLGAVAAVLWLCVVPLQAKASTLSHLASFSGWETAPFVYYVI